jgi:dihydroorotase
MTYILRNALIVNEGKRFYSDVLIRKGRIEKLAPFIDIPFNYTEFNAENRLLLPGLIDDQVHFREPGLTHKGDLFTESRAAVAGGITSYMEMPNTVPGALTQALLEQKYQRASQVSLGNYSFYMGTSNDNLEEILKTDKSKVCGVKIFMGSSTGNMLVDQPGTLENVFSKVDMLIATHCELDGIIKDNLEKIKAEFGEDLTAEFHPKIRNAEACYASSSMAIALAKKHGTRLHILHISTAKELELFESIPLSEKRITAEACIHHLWFSAEDYAEKGNWIKWNPSVKYMEDREAIRRAVKDGRIDVLATDHAPHTIEEKSQSYLNAPSGGPLVQHALVALLEMEKQGIFDLETIVQKYCHNVADLFKVKERGYIREGYWADLVLVNHHSPWLVNKDNLLYKCGWSPFEGQEFSAAVEKTFVNGQLAYFNGKIMEVGPGMRLEFER